MNTENPMVSQDLRDGAERGGECLPVPSPQSIGFSEFGEDGSWYMVGDTSIGQGWKLYISATLANYTELIPHVVAIASRHGFCCKYLRSVQLLAQANSGQLGYSQIGKSIVIYVDRDVCINEFLDAIKSLVEAREHVGPRIPRLPRIWDHLPVSYRYGSYRAPYMDVGETRYNDDRNSPFNFEEHGLRDVFRAHGGPPGNPSKSDVLARYPIIGEFYRSGKGGVFVSLDLSAHELTEVVVKIGVRHGQVVIGGVDAFEMAKYEARVYDLMALNGCRPYIPGKIDEIECDDAFCLVLQYLPHANMAERRCEGSLSVAMIEDAIGIIDAIKCKGFRIRDAKLSNFIHDGKGCWLIDLESVSSSVVAEVDSSGPSTFRIVGVSSDDPRFEVMHFLVSCLYPLRQESDSTFGDRQVDVDRLIACCSAGCHVQAWVIRELISRMTGNIP
jgi:hypothetical protein